jgi:undecaprenyl diphosphate synthase
MDKLVPAHVAIIMDGNGRWAKKRGLPRIFGHREGIKNLESLVKFADKKGIKVLTVFAFSTENWSRPKREVDMLLRAFDNFIKMKLKDMFGAGIRMQVMGSLKNVPAFLLRRIKEAETKTAANKGIILNVAFNYGSRLEILEAAKKIARDCLEKKISLDKINEELFSDYLYTRGLPELDFLIRTSGELRLSNFLLWQASYAELYFTEKFWPEFKEKDFEAALDEYAFRQRRFGKV